MLTREQIEEIQTESREKGISIKNLLKEKGIPEHQYFWWKRKYNKVEVPEGFLPVAGGGLPRTLRIILAITSIPQNDRRLSPLSKSAFLLTASLWCEFQKL